jgi:hypothetical protein
MLDMMTLTSGWTTNSTEESAVARHLHVTVSQRVGAFSSDASAQALTATVITALSDHITALLQLAVHKSHCHKSKLFSCIKISFRLFLGLTEGSLYLAKTQAAGS